MQFEFPALLFMALCSTIALSTFTSEHPHARLTTPELITARGYPSEIHHVITEDGFILELHRIPFGRKIQAQSYIEGYDYAQEIAQEYSGPDEHAGNLLLPSPIHAKEYKGPPEHAQNFPPLQIHAQEYKGPSEHAQNIPPLQIHAHTNSHEVSHFHAQGFDRAFREAQNNAHNLAPIHYSPRNREKINAQIPIHQKTARHNLVKRQSTPQLKFPAKSYSPVDIKTTRTFKPGNVNSNFTYESKNVGKKWREGKRKGKRGRFGEKRGRREKREEREERDIGEKRAVLLVHGLLASSAEFILNDPDQALGFILADAGYDVWLGNLRGNFYSRQHTYLYPDEFKFWDHTWTELARYDLPAMLGYVKKTSGARRVSYVGHSLGTALFFIMFNYHPEIANWVTGMAGLAPVSYLYHRGYPFGLFSPFVYNIEQALNYSKTYELLPLTPDTHAGRSTLFCSPNSPTREICVLSHQAMFGVNMNYVDKEYFPVILSHSPAGIGYRIFLHLLQLHQSKRFRAFDYGPSRNLEEYGQTTPPDFSLSTVTPPVGLFWSQKDFLADYRDVAQTAAELPNVAVNHRVAVDDYNHMDFLWAENANEVVYKPAMEFLDSLYY